MQNWTGSIAPINWRIRIASGTRCSARPAIAIRTAVTSTDGPGWAKKTSDCTAPSGSRSSHHTGRVALFLGRIGVGIGSAGLVLTELMARVRGRLSGLTCRGERAVPGRLLGRDLGREETVVHGVLEAAKPALFVLGRVLGRWRLGHLLTHGRLAAFASRPESQYGRSQSEAMR